MDLNESEKLGVMMCKTMQKEQPSRFHGEGSLASPRVAQERGSKHIGGVPFPLISAMML